VRDTESDLLFHHSTRVYYFGALAGLRQKLKFDSELLYIGAMFHDMGLTKEYRSATERFEVDSANAARDFLRQHGIDEASIDVVWGAISLHTAPGIPRHKKPEVALVTAGVDMDVLGLGYLDVSDADREAVVKAHPRGDHFKEQIIHAFHDGFGHKPETVLWATVIANYKLKALSRGRKSSTISPKLLPVPQICDSGADKRVPNDFVLFSRPKTSYRKGGAGFRRQ
jgi:hypothetical protein